MAKILTKENNLLALYPHIAKEWHPTKNEIKSPTKIFPGTNKKVWWVCSSCSREWQARVDSRTRSNKTRCGSCNKTKWRLSNDNNLEKLFPNLVKEWHPTKNGDLLPSKMTPFKKIKVWWLCKRGHEWQTILHSRTYNKSSCNECRFLENNNDLQSKSPDIAKEWHPTKNGTYTPSDFSYGSGKEIWWICEKGHSWLTPIHNRTSNKNGCPHCSRNTSRAQLYIYSELSTIFNKVFHRKNLKGLESDIYVEDLSLSIEYDGNYFHRNKLSKDIAKKKKMELNGYNTINIRVKPLEILGKNDIVLSEKILDYDLVLELLKHLLLLDFIDLESKDKISKYLSNSKPKNEKYYNKLLTYLPGPIPENSILYTHLHLISEWNNKRNKPLEPSNFSQGSSHVVWWICSKGHEWQAPIYRRTKKNPSGCVKCFHKSRQPSTENSILHTHEHLISEWNHERNKPLEPSNFSHGSSNVVWWICSKGHEWQAPIYRRTKKKPPGCPYCLNKKVGYGNDLQSKFPKISKEWHPTKNGDLKPNEFVPGSDKRIWWQCKKGHEWATRILKRTDVNNKGCKECYRMNKKNDT